MTRIIALAALITLGTSVAARAQSPGSDDWNIGVYPILVWIPLGIGIDIDVPPVGGDGGGTADIVDSRFDADVSPQGGRRGEETDQRQHGNAQ
mgnify:CR=1 FL=1